MRLSTRIVAILIDIAALFVILGAVASAPREAHAADDTLDLKLRSGAEFKGRIGARDDAGFVLRSDGGGDLRIAWKDLDERSWFVAKRAVADPKDAKNLLDLGTYAVEHGWRVDAEQTLAAALRLDATLKPAADALAPKLDVLRRSDAGALMTKAKEHAEAKRWLQSLGRYRDALALDPKNAMAANGVGEAYFFLRRLPDARASMESAIRLDPACKDALFNLAMLDLLELDFAGCKEGLAKVIALPVAEGRVATPQDLGKKASENKSLTQEQILEQFADMPAFQARQFAPVIEGIVAGPGFATPYRSVTKHYDLVTDVSQAYADVLTAKMEIIYAEYDRRFGFSKTGEVKTRGKDLRFPVIVFKDRKNYVEWFGRVLHNPQMGAMTGGVYVSAVKHLVFFQNKTLEDTLLVAWHEGFHQYLDYFIEGAPHWFNEGQAEYFGASDYDEAKKKVKVGQSNAWRVPVLKALIAQKRIPDAKWFMQTDAATFMRVQSDPQYGKQGTTVGDHYALGWAIVHYCLEGDKGRWQKSFLDYFKILCDGTPHAEAFERAWGRTDWRAFQAGFEAHCEWLVSRAETEAKGPTGK